MIIWMSLQAKKGISLYDCDESKGVYEKWYRKKGYGLCEINRDKVKGARCLYTDRLSAGKRGAAPEYVDHDAKDTSGAACKAGKDEKKAYGVTNRHTPEIEEQLGSAKEIVVTPHLVPMNRGILATEYAALVKADGTYEEVKAVYDKYYGKAKFYRSEMGRGQ